MKLLILMISVMSLTGFVHSQEKLNITKKGLVLKGKVIKGADLEKKKTYVLEIGKDITCEEFSKYIPIEYQQRVLYKNDKFTIKYFKEGDDLSPPPLSIYIRKNHYMCQNQKKTLDELKIFLSRLKDLNGDKMVIKLPLTQVKSMPFSKVIPLIKIVPSLYLSFTPELEPLEQEQE